MRVLLSLLLSVNMCYLEAAMIHREMIAPEWKEESTPPFDELMLSWNAARPIKGGYLFYASVKTDD